MRNFQYNDFGADFTLKKVKFGPIGRGAQPRAPFKFANASKGTCFSV